MRWLKCTPPSNIAASAEVTTIINIIKHTNLHKTRETGNMLGEGCRDMTWKVRETGDMLGEGCRDMTWKTRETGDMLGEGRRDINWKTRETVICLVRAVEI